MMQEVMIGRVNTDWLNMRSTPGGKVLALLKGGSEVSVVGNSGGWLDVWYGGVRGSVASRYITLQPQIEMMPDEDDEDQFESTAAPSEFERIGEVTASSLNLRDSPNGHILIGLSRATRVTIISEAAGWMKVQVQGRQGYVSSRYINPTRIRRLDPPLSSLNKSTERLQFRFEGKKVISPDGDVFARKFRKGVFSSGKTSIQEFIQQQSGLDDSVGVSNVRLLQAVSENEGKLEAINTWDNAFLSFGIFQWTAGVGGEAGELPALLARLKEKFPDSYEKYFGQYGLEVTAVRETTGSPARGFFKLNGHLLASGEQKEVLRSLEWPYNCKQAGLDESVRLIELEHAIARIDCFLRVDNRRVQGHHIGDYITSEYGVAQLLDQHVNRPAHVLRVVTKAVEELSAEGINIDKPEEWGDGEEMRLLGIYLKFRGETSMTDGVLRAERIERQLNDGVISGSRYSYKS